MIRRKINIREIFKLKSVLTFLVMFILLYILGLGLKTYYTTKASPASASPPKVKTLKKPRTPKTRLAPTTSKTTESTTKPQKEKNIDKGDNSIVLPFSKLIETSSVNAIESDRAGNVWVATESGVTSIGTDRNKIKHYSLKDGTFPFAQASSLAFFGKTLWVGSLFGLCKLSKSGLFVVAEESAQLPSPIVWDLHWDQTTLWISTQRGVTFITNNGDPQSLTSKSTNSALKNNWCKKLTKVKNWFIVLNDADISFWNTNFPASNPSIWKKISIESSVLPRSINDLTTDNNYLWLATANGLFQLNVQVDKIISEPLNKFNTYTRLNGLESNNILSVIHHKDSVWAGTAEGLARIRNERVQMIYPNYGEYYKEIKYLHAMGDILWLGTKQGVQFINTAMVGQND